MPDLGGHDHFEQKGAGKRGIRLPGLRAQRREGRRYGRKFHQYKWNAQEGEVSS